MDELWELTIVHLPADEIVGVGDGFPPLFHLLFRGLIVGGLGDMAGRFISAALGIATVWVAGSLGRRISDTVGVGAAFGVAVTPLLVLLSKEGRAYGLFILLAALLLATTWDVIDSDSNRSWIAFGVVAALGMYTHYMFALALASAEAVILWNLREGLSLRKWFTAHAALAIALIPLILIAIPDFELDAANDYSRTVDLPAIAYAGLSLFTGFTLGPSTSDLHTLSTMDAITSAAPWILLICIPASYLGYHGWQALSPKWRIQLGVPMVLPVALLSVFSVVVGVAFRVRYLSWLAIPLVIWLAAGFSRTKRNTRYLAVGTLVVLAGAAMITRIAIDDYKVEDAEAAAAYIEQHPDTPTVAMAWYMARPIEYYIDQEAAIYLPPDEGWGRFDYHDLLDNRVVPLPSLVEEDPEFEEQLGLFARTVDMGEEYFFVYSREFHADPDGSFFELRQEADGLVPTAEFAGITIYRGVRGS